MKSDYEIAQENISQPITAIAEKMGLPPEMLIPYGRYKAKIDIRSFDEKKVAKSKLILVTAITPTKAGIGKTTTSVGLADGLNKLNKKVVLALREPSLGPCFGMKGGAAGGGYSQVVPMEEINLHFTGDFHAITAANNNLAALLDNFRFYNRGKPEGIKTVLWKRCLDVNDRVLRKIVTALDTPNNGIPSETGFVITPASEIMAVLCLSEGLEELRKKIDNILLGFTFAGEPFTTKDLGVTGAITALLKDAIQPNLVQTLEGTPAMVHGGPFANIAHGCNSLMATKTALQFGDYVVTEAGFATDLGAEKFFNIKCRKAGLQPAMSVLVATSQALKLSGGADAKTMMLPDMAVLAKGVRNLEKHISILKSFKQKVLVVLNRYQFDTVEEITWLRNWCAEKDVAFAVNDGFTNGGEGALEMAQAVVDICENPSPPIQYTYELSDDIETKIRKIATTIYGATDVVLYKKAQDMIKKIKTLGLEQLPVCMAKTQYSFTHDPTKSGLDGDFKIDVDDLVINQGAGFIVAVCGEMVRMPGLPKIPQANNIDVVDGKIIGVS
ncbi:MAG: formate--tetrahydrofolate ligase [Chitinophagaceae bacterium]|nr:formate--tetrahydrofolate ligase [Chitinophagaceae bacterium]MBK7307172.1 formate--tetrahydrofolate ligase [Chitinophagaceae bacterium]MBK8785426.1 formate--tetrahydrofolate ligase [Chitinophagaceae bacterium]MBL0199203.1 formate--tetrahydrofolate ligase [Chitinophagaceae bacterium]